VIGTVICAGRPFPGVNINTHVQWRCIYVNGFQSVNKNVIIQMMHLRVIAKHLTKMTKVNVKQSPSILQNVNISVAYSECTADAYINEIVDE